MKTLLLSLCIVLSAAAHGQWEHRYTTEDVVYDMPKPGTLPVRISMNLNYAQLYMEFMSTKQADSIPNIDSLLKAVLKDVLPAAYGEKKPTISRRIDYETGGGGTFRVVEYQPKGITYFKKNGKVVEGRVESDTLRIRLFTRREMKGTMFPMQDSYYLTFTYSDLKFLTGLRPSLLDSAVADVKRELHGKKNIASLRMNGGYQYSMKERTSAWQEPKRSKDWSNRYTFEPDIQVGFQYARGGWAPSAAAGLQYAKEAGYGKRDMFELFWEPYFFFGRDINNKVVTDRNDFITFKFYHYEKEGAGIMDDYPGNFSLGYLIRRRGDWFEKNTFKFTIPGVHYKFVWMEPEFFFNDLFKNFSPSLRMTLEID